MNTLTQLALGLMGKVCSAAGCQDFVDRAALDATSETA
jgi:hypothetical protein